MSVDPIARLEHTVRAALVGCSAVFTIGRAGDHVEGGGARGDYAQALALGHAGQERRARFCRGRRLARAGLEALGCADVIVGRDRHGCPLWPPGFIGSISHSDTASATLTARRGRISAVGIDLERVGRFGAELWPSVFTAAEMQRLLGISGRAERDRVATLLFSAKEAVQKARYADTGAWSEHRHLAVSLDLRRQRFHVGGGAGEAGLYRTEGALVFCAFFVGAIPPQHERACGVEP